MALRATPALLVAAFATVYIVWGSTYLAIFWAIETMPPLLMAGARWILPGLVLYGIARARGAAAPTLREWKAATVVGLALIVGGNGGVTVAEKWVPSGITALLVACVPLWLVVLDWARPAGARPAALTFVGLALGLAGVLLLMGPGIAGVALDPLGVALVLGATLSWAAGSLYSRTAPLPKSLFLAVAMEMLAGGVALMLLGLGAGEAAALDPAAWTTRSLLSFAFLAVLGSLVAFSAYLWLLQVASPAAVGTYAFVNPVVAVFLGWLLAGEVVTGGALAASALIVAGVATILWSRARAAPPPAPPQEPRAASPPLPR